MKNIIVLNQIADTVTLYANCFKSGYTRLCYFCDPQNITTIELQSPRITIKDLTEREYFFYCLNNADEETGHISISIATTSYKTFWNNLMTYSGIKQKTEELQKIKEPDYIMALYKKAITDKNGIADYEELLLSCVSFYNIRQESLNAAIVPELSFKNNIIASTNKLKYQFLVYVYDKAKDIWKIIPGQSKEKTNIFEFSGKPSLMYRICVLSDSSVVREYLYYQPSSTLSEAILEGRISAKRQLTEKTAEMMSKFDMTEITDDMYGQQVVCALQEIKPAHPVLPAPRVTYNSSSGLFYVNFAQPSLFPTSDYTIYLAALGIEQIFYGSSVPYKILAMGENFILNPVICKLSYGDDYIFYFCNKDGKIISDPSLCGYDTEANLDLYYSVSKKADIEEYRRRLFNVFKEYNKSEWNTVSAMLDRYIAYPENYYQPVTDYLLENISRLDTVHHRVEYLMQLVLLNQLRHYTPIDQTFIRQQVYAEGYHKHVFPEAEKYIIRRGRLNKNTLVWDYISCGEKVAEIPTNKDTCLILQALDRTIDKASPYAFYHNIYSGNTRYFYYPDLEVTVSHGLY